MVEEGTFEHSAHQWWPFPLPSPLLPPRRRSSFVPPMMSAVRGKHGKGRWVWSPRGSSPLSVPTTTNIFLSWAPPTDRRHLFLLSPSPSSNTRGALLPLGWVGPGGRVGWAAFWSLSEEQTTASGLPPPLFFYFRPPFSLGIFFFSPPLFRRHFLPLHLAAQNEKAEKAKRAEMGFGGVPVPLHFFAPPRSFFWLFVCEGRLSPPPPGTLGQKKGISAYSALVGRNGLTPK